MQKTLCKCSVKLCTYKQPLALGTVQHVHGIELGFKLNLKFFKFEKNGFKPKSKGSKIRKN